MAKKKDASTGSADASVLRRSGRETTSRKQTTPSPLSSRKSERVNKNTSPSPSPVRNKLEKVEKQIGSSPLRRSDRGKKLIEMPSLPNIRSTKEKTANNSKQSIEDVNEDKNSEKQDSDIGDRKRKRFTALHYKATFKPQRIRIESDDDENQEAEVKSPQASTSKNEDVVKELKSQNSIRVREVPDKEHKALLGGRVIDLDQIEHGDCPRTKSLHGKPIGSGDKDKENGGNVLPSNGNIANSNNYMSHSPSYTIEHDLENQQELGACHKVIETHKAAGITENAENNDVSSNMQKCKFVEFWVPVQLSNVQLEQYCATLLSNATALCSSLKSDTFWALKETLTINRKCCNHPYTVDRKIQESLIKDKDPSVILDIGIEASGKLQFLDHILPEIRKRQLRVLILFQPTRGVLSSSLSLGEIIVDFVHRRFGQNSHEHVNGLPNISSKKQAAINMFNKDMTKFIFLLESRTCHPDIKLLSVDAIIIFDSELTPSNDLKSLQKLSVYSQSEQIMIFRLYSSSTLEEKILKLAESNVAVDSRSPNLRSSYDALLTWGASDLFEKLTKFHSQAVLDISSEKSFLKDVVEEVLYTLSHKYKHNDTTWKSIITRVQNCGNYGKSTPLHGEVKTHLPDGHQPYIFWKNLLEGQRPVWKFVSESTPRQRKRPNYFLEGKSVDDGSVKTRRRTVNNNTVEPVQLNIATNGETGVNEDQFWSTTVDAETSLLDRLKPTVSKLFNILKFSEDVKITVERFLKFVLENYYVSEEPKDTLQAFMISLCWIGSSLAKKNIDRSESFALAKKLGDFSCTEEETESLYEKLKIIKETYLERTQVRPAIKDCVPAPEVDVSNEKSQHITNVDVSNENVSRKGVEAFEKYNKEWEEKRASLENEYKVENAIIHALFRSNPSIRSEKLKMKEREYANKFKEHDSQKRLWEDRLEELKATMLAGEEPVVADNHFSLHRSQHETQVVPSGNPEVAITLPENTIEAQSPDEPVCEGANDIESTGSHTSEKVTVDAAVSSEQTGVPSQQHGDDMEVDVAEKVDSGHANAKGGTTRPLAIEDPVKEHNETGANDVALHADCGDVEIRAGNDNKENDEDGTVGLDEYDHSETCANDMAPHVYSGDMEMPAGNEKENDDDGTVGLDENDLNENGANDMAPYVDSGDMGMPAGNYNKENDECGTVGLDTSHVVEDHPETVDDVVPEVESAEMATPAGICDIGSLEEGEIQPDAPDAGGNRNETSPNDVLPCVAPAEIATPSGTCDIESPEEGEIQPDASGADGDHDETSPNDVLPCVVSAEMATPGDNEENAEDSIIRPDVLHANEDHNGPCGSNSSNPVCAAITQEKSPSVQPVSSPASDHLETIIPDSGVQDEDIIVGDPQPSGVNQLDQIILDDEPNIPSSTDPVCAAMALDKTPSVQPVSSPASDRVNRLDQIILDDVPNIPLSTDPVCAAMSLDKTPNVQPVSSPASDRVEPIFPEIQNDSLQLEQLPDSGVQDEEINVGSLQPSGASQLDHIILDDEPDFLSSTDPTVAENPSNTVLPSEPLLEPTCEEPTLTVSQSVENVEENPVPACETPHEEHQTRVATSVAPAPLVNALDMFDNLPYRVNPQMPNQTDPLQAEVDRLKAIGDLVTKSYQETKQRLDTERDKEIAEAIARITLKYEAKHVEADATYNSKKTKLETNINRVNMNKILALAFRSKCQDVTPSGHAVPQAGFMQQLHRLPGSPSVRHYSSSPSASPGESSGNRQSPQQPSLPLLQPQPQQLRPQPPLSLQQPQLRPQPPLSLPQPQLRPQPPLQIVHQPAALFSSTPGRTPSATPNRAPPSNTSCSITPSRQPPVVNQMTYSTPPTTSRHLPTTPPIVNQVTPSTTPTTSRPPPVNNVGSLNKRPPIIAQIDMSAANLRISTETRRQSPHTRATAPNIQPLVSSESRAPTPIVRPLASSEPRAAAPNIRPLASSEPRAAAPNIRPLVSSEPRAAAPHLRPLVSREPRAPAPHLRSMASTEIRARAPHMQPFRSMPSVSPDVGTHRGVPPSQHVTGGSSQSPVLPPLSTSSPQSLTPQPPTSEPCIVPLSTPSAQTQPSDNSNGLVGSAPRWVNVTAPQPDPKSQNDMVDVTDLVREGTAPSSSARDLVYLSDDD